MHCFADDALIYVTDHTTSDMIVLIINLVLHIHTVCVNKQTQDQIASFCKFTVITGCSWSQIAPHLLRLLASCRKRKTIFMYIIIFPYFYTHRSVLSEPDRPRSCFRDFIINSHTYSQLNQLDSCKVTSK